MGKGIASVCTAADVVNALSDHQGTSCNQRQAGHAPHDEHGRRATTTGSAIIQPILNYRVDHLVPKLQLGNAFVRKLRFTSFSVVFSVFSAEKSSHNAKIQNVCMT